MQPAGTDPVLAHWREVGEWWRFEPQREIVRFLDDKGMRREVMRELPPIVLDDTGQKDHAPDHREDWVLRERKIRDEKVSAACGVLPDWYYEREAEEKSELQLPQRWRSMGSRPEGRGNRPDNLASPITSAEILRPTQASYVPLHVKSGYAFGQSTLLPEEIATCAAQAGCPAVAIADPHSLAGAYEFAKACKRHGVQALIGASIELPEGGKIVLIARSKAGYRSLSHLITACHLGEQRSFPLGSWERLHRFPQELVCLTGGEEGPIHRALTRGHTERASQLLEQLVSIYGASNVFLEMERSFLPWQHRLESTLLELAEYHHVTPVAGGAITHGRRDHFPAQDILTCVETLCLVEEVIGRKPTRSEHQPSARAYPQRALNAERYLRSSQEMADLYSDRPELLFNTLKVMERCDPDVLPGRTQLPSLYPDDAHVLSEIVRARAHHMYDLRKKPIRNRIEYELKTICGLGYATHFMIAADFCDWARDRDIQFSGRGSVVDSAVSYILGFSRIDAIRHKLHFERFLPPDGTKRPDIDIDFEAKRRDDIRNYVTNKYGKDYVATVAAFGAYCTRGIIREVGKALGIPSETIGFLAKKVHGGVPPDQIESALESRPELKGANIPKERFRWVFRLSERLMDIPRNIRTHSSGVVVSATPMADTVPVMWAATEQALEGGVENLRMIQWDKRSAKHCFDKFDILCLRGQDVLSGTESRVRQSEPKFDVTAISTDDPDTYRAMRSGELIGIPQSASPAMRQAHVRLRTENLDDASLVQAGIRPGVGGAVKINELIARRRGTKPYHFDHPKMEEILGHTYGIIVFQEQVDQLLTTFGGYSPGEAEDIRDAIHKRRREDYGQIIRQELIEKVLSNGYSTIIAEQVYDYVAGFKGYGFAQGHALAFAEISIRSIWCQQHYPAEYFASLLSAQPAGYYGPCTLVNEARSRGVAVLPPCVSRSRDVFTVEDVRSSQDPKIVFPRGGLRVGLSQIHGLSRETVQSILTWQEKPPAIPSFNRFVREVRPNRDELESLILCGAMDLFSANRRAMLWAIPQALQEAGWLQENVNQPHLPIEPAEGELPENLEDFSIKERAIHERSILGLDVANHLMAFERAKISRKDGLTTAQARQLKDGERAIVVGNPMRLRFPPTPTGKRVVFFDLEDETGLLNVTCFDDVYRRDGHAIVCSPYVTLIGHGQDRDGHMAFLAQRVFPYEPELAKTDTASITLPVASADFLVG